jgi:hypothetical protein
MAARKITKSRARCTIHVSIDLGVDTWDLACTGDQIVEDARRKASIRLHSLIVEHRDVTAVLSNVSVELETETHP